MKNNKRVNMRLIILIVIIVIAAYFYAHIDKMHVIYDRDLDTSEYTATGILRDDVLEQKIISQEEWLDGINVKCQLIGEVDSAAIVYELLEADTGVKVAEGTVKGEEIDNNKFNKLKFEDTVENCKGKRYILRLREERESADQGIGFYYENKVESGTQLSIAGEKIKGTLIAKTITHRFDLETFIVLIGFIVFIGTFIKILYGLFE